MVLQLISKAIDITKDYDFGIRLLILKYLIILLSSENAFACSERTVCYSDIRADY